MRRQAGGEEAIESFRPAEGDPLPPSSVVGESTKVAHGRHR
jgi:hypothetical protein